MKATIARFDARWTVDWHYGYWLRGRQARLDGKTLRDIPDAGIHGLWQVKSWRAGWVDTDQALMDDERNESEG